MAKPLPPESLRKVCPPESLSFQSTEDLPVLEEVVAQDRAVQAIAFGTAIRSAGFNLFALGPPGSGKMSAVKRFLAGEATKLPAPADWCYVNNFADPHRPRALRLAPGKAREFRDDCQRLLEELMRGIPRAFEAEPYEQQRRKLIEEAQKRQAGELEALQERAKERGFGLVKTPSGFMVAPMLRGQVLKPEGLEALEEAAREEVQRRSETVQQDLAATLRRIRDIEREAKARLDALDREVATSAVDHPLEELKEKYRDHAGILQHLEALREDVLESVDLFRRERGGEGPAEALAAMAQAQLGRDPFDRYRVNLLVEHADAGGAPVVVEAHPTCQNLLGRIEHQAHMGALFTNFMMVKAGALHRANGGFLVLEILEVLRQYFAWDPLKRSLKNKQIKIEEPGEQFRLVSTVTLEPEPIPLDVKVVLVGSPWLYYLLYYLDPEFPELFKVKVDFGPEMARTPENIAAFARLLATTAREEGLLPFDRTAVAGMVEHSSRMVEDQERLATTFGELLDVAREAHFWATRDGHVRVTGEDVRRAVDARRYRSNRIEERLRDLITEGTLLIATEGAAQGQVNGIAVVPIGDYWFGKPSRITARTYLGRGGIVDIEREARTGGRIHSKGVLILTGYLAGRYAQRLPLSLSASLGFEQVYEEIEGDSASSAELYAILSSLSGLPIRQSLAVTGSVNQQGEVQAIGGVNAKIEGFFDVCAARGLSGEQGVLIPASNVRHLMLREDVVEAVRAGRYHVYAVRTIDEGIEILSGTPAGERGPDGAYPEGSVNFLVDKRLREMAEQARNQQRGEPERRPAQAAEAEAPKPPGPPEPPGPPPAA